MRFFGILLIFTILSFAPTLGQIYGQELLIVNAYNRSSQTLNGDWNYIIDPYENGFYNYRYEPFENSDNPASGAYFTNTKPADKTSLIEYDFDKSPTLKVPGDWNSQTEKLLYYEGTVWYKKSFDYAPSQNDSRAFIYFGAINYRADVYLNGKKIGNHIGGFTPFNFEVTGLLKKTDNFLIVKVENKRLKEGVPTLNTDWWNYGGIARDVQLIETPANFIRDYFIQLDPKDPNKLTGYVYLDQKQAGEQKVHLKIPEINFDKEFATDQAGFARIDSEIKGLEYWSPENPKLYEIVLTSGNDELRDRIGLRLVSTKGKDILLNGKKIFLRGISIHEENPIRGGRAYSIEDARQMLGWAKELGCNYVRLAHYPHNENMIRLADEMGILVWEEIPVYWTIAWENLETFQNAQTQLTEMIHRDKNRAATIIWSMANETPVSESRNEFLTKLVIKARQIDPTRLISAALEQSSYNGDPLTRTIYDPFAEKVDILSFNEYIGWYDGLPEKIRQIKWRIGQNKPVVVSEFGAGAKYGFHADKDTRWSEEYQADLYKETLKMLGNIEQLSGISPWVLVDFRSPRRHLPQIQDGWNRKGLISEKGEKKKAFFVLKEYYNKQK